MVTTGSRLDFGYRWVWTHGHLVPAVGFALGAAGTWLAGANHWVGLSLAGLAVWALAGFVAVRHVIRMNEPLSLPTATFLSGGAGKVLDVGCGTGRTSIMVGLARPQATLTALDNFSASYIAGHGPAKTMDNFQAAGIADRAAIREGDFRQLAFASRSFDAAVSSYAIDHLAPDEIPVALAEVQRVLRPGGEFLLLVIVPTVATLTAYGPLVLGAFRSRGYWREALRQAGFDLTESGSANGCAWFLARQDGREALDPATANVVRPIAFASGLPSDRRDPHSRIHDAALPLLAVGALIAAFMLLAGVSASWWWYVPLLTGAFHVGAILAVISGMLWWSHHKQG